MKNLVVPINISLFLTDYETFEKLGLPIVNQERLRQNQPVLSQPEEIMDCYLDLLKEYGVKLVDKDGNGGC